MNYPYVPLGVQVDGSSCGFWAATIALLLAFSINVEANSVKRKLVELGPTGIKEFWISAASSFRSSKTEGLDRQTVEAFLSQFKGKGMKNEWSNKLGAKECVSEIIETLDCSHFMHARLLFNPII